MTGDTPSIASLEKARGSLPLGGWPIEREFGVSYRVTDELDSVHHQQFHHGELVSWELGEPHRSDLTVHWSRASERRGFAQELEASDFSSNAVAFSAEAAGERCGLLPSDPLTIHLCSSLPEYRGATVTVNYRLTDGLVPDLPFMHRIRDGKLEEAEYRHADDAQLTVAASWDWLLEFLRGDCGLLEILNHGRIEGELFPAQVVATGVLESEEYREIWTERSNVYDQIDEWVNLMTSPGASRLAELLP